MTDETTENLQEQIFTAKILNAASAETSASLDRLSAWATAGAAAALALLLGNISNIAAHVPVTELRRAAALLPWVFVFAVLQKLCASLASANVRAHEVGSKLGAEAAANNVDLDFAVIFAEVTGCFPRPLRWLVSRNFTKAQKGDLLGPTRTIVRLVILQSILLLGQVLTIVCALLAMSL